MNRVRWLRTEWPISMRTMAAKMKAQAFKRDSFDGFVIERVRDTFIEARYIEKLNYQETITDPFGVEQMYDRVAYRSVSFSLFSDYPQIELYDANRSTKEFINKLIEMYNFSLAVVPLSVKVLEWIDNFQKLTKQKVLVDSIQISGLQLEPGVVAKILLKGDYDVRGALRAIAEQRNFSLDRVQMRYTSGSGIIPVQLASSGTISVPDYHKNEVLPLLRESLPRPVK